MRLSTEVIGLKNILGNLEVSKQRVGGAVGRGIKKAGLILQAESQKLVPVDFGILKASAFTRANNKASSFKTVVEVGYTAAYAIFVHENVEMKGKGLPRKAPHKGFYWDPQGTATAKFLEKPFKTFGPVLRQTVADEVKGFLK